MFKDNTTIETVTMADTVTKIEAQAFCNCTSIAEITLSNNLKSVGEMAFRLTTFKNIVFPASLETTGDLLFSQSLVESVEFQGKDCNFGSSTLAYTSNLKTVVLPSELKILSDAFFNSATSLTTVTLPNTVTEIGHHAFNGCTNLSTFTIPNSVTTIGTTAFNGCSSLNLVIPQTVTNIAFGDYWVSTQTLTFYNVPSLTIPSKWKTDLENSGSNTGGAKNIIYS